MPQRAPENPAESPGGSGWLGGGGGAPPEEEAPEPAPAASAEESGGGGLWVACHDAFAPSGVPLRDVTRLGLMCGPVNGLRRHGDAQAGRLAAGAVAAHPFRAQRGECFRIFVVAEPNDIDVDVQLVSSRSARLTADAGDGAWAIIEADRPFCALGDDELSAEVSADAAGRYALEVWRLPRTGAMD